MIGRARGGLRPSQKVAVAVLLLWLATRVLLLVLALNPALYSGAIQGDVRGYGAKVERIFQGEVPYRDVAIEYPPGSLPFTVLPGVLVGTGEHYRFAFALTMLAVDALGLYASARLARTVDRGPAGVGEPGSLGSAVVRARIPLAYVLGALALGPVMFMRFDLVPAVCVLLATTFAAARRPGAAAAALGYGAAAKLFPAVLAPLLVLAIVPRLGWVRALLRTVPPFLLAFGVTVVPALAWSAQGTINSAIVYHMDRGVQVESLWANLLAIAHAVGGLPAHTAHQYGAYDIFTPWSPLAKTLSTVATAVALLGACALVWWRAARDRGLAGQAWALAAGIGVLAFMLPTRVLSPQYLIWLMPVAAALVTRAPARSSLWLLAAAGVLTQVIFPFRYTQLRNLEPLEIVLLTARNALLVATAVIMVRCLTDRRVPAAPPPPEHEPAPPASGPQPEPAPSPKQPVST